MKCIQEVELRGWDFYGSSKCDTCCLMAVRGFELAASLRSRALRSVPLSCMMGSFYGSIVAVLVLAIFIFFGWESILCIAIA